MKKPKPPNRRAMARTIKHLTEQVNNLQNRLAECQSQLAADESARKAISEENPPRADQIDAAARELLTARDSFHAGMTRATVLMLNTAAAMRESATKWRPRR